MELTLEDLKSHVEKYFEVNGKYPSNLRLSRKTRRASGVAKYCSEKKIKVTNV